MAVVVDVALALEAAVGPMLNLSRPTTSTPMTRATTRKPIVTRKFIGGISDEQSSGASTRLPPRPPVLPAGGTGSWSTPPGSFAAPSARPCAAWYLVHERR